MIDPNLAATLRSRVSLPLVLASKSVTRAHMLEQAGIAVEVVPATIDEREVEAPAMASGATPADVARLLSVAKAADVSARMPGRIVIGSDQTLALGQLRFSKPKSRDQAAEQLRALRGRSHVLASGAALVWNGQTVWSAVAEARLAMRPFSDEFLDSYLDRAGPLVSTTVGGYQLEGLGVQLFEAVEGDYFTVLGLPLLKVLAALRTLGLLEV